MAFLRRRTEAENEVERIRLEDIAKEQEAVVARLAVVEAKVDNLKSEIVRLRGKNGV